MTKRGIKAALDKENQSEFRYRQLLTQHIGRMLVERELDFCSLVSCAGGAYPTDVFSVLKELKQGQILPTPEKLKPLVQDRMLGALNVDVAHAREHTGIQHENSPTDFDTSDYFGDPHPADYDWRYSRSSLVLLKERASRTLQAGGKVALLGCPTLFPVLASVDGEVTLFDKRKSALDHLRSIGSGQCLVRHDLFDPLRGIKSDYDLVIADPPWYPPFHEAFIMRASELLRQGGVLLLSVLPWLTRPKAINDRAAIFEFARRIAFDLSSFEEGLLRYQTPPFERASLATQGIECGDWRSGDLGTFRKIGESGEIATARPSDEPEWDDFRFGRRTVKLRHRKEDRQTSFRAEFVDANAVLRSVSRRSPLRAKINLWTSDNVAYKVSRLPVLREALTRLQAGEAPRKVASELAESFELAPRESQDLYELLLILQHGNSANITERVSGRSEHDQD